MNAPRLLSLISLVAWGGLMLYIYYSGRISSFLHPNFRPWVMIAGWTLVGLALVYWRFSRRGTFADHQHDEVVLAAAPTYGTEESPSTCHHHDHHDHHVHDADCGHPHDHAEQSLTAPQLAGFIILLVPALTAAMVSEDSFSATAFENRLPLESLPIPPSSLPAGGAIEDEQGFFENEDILQYFDRTPEGHVEIEVIDLLYGSMDAVFRRDFSGQNVAIIGQALPQRSGGQGVAASRPDDVMQPPQHRETAGESSPLEDLSSDTGTSKSQDEFLLGRMFMLCCANDARPVTIRIEYVSDDPLPKAGWVRIVGKPVFQKVDDVWVTVLRASEVTATEKPREIFLY